MTAAPWPRDLTYSRSTRLLTVTFDSGETFTLPAELLRVESPSAEVQGHGPGQKQIVAGKAQVEIERIEPVGRYAVRIVFNDGHNSGLYTWNYLHKLGREKDRLWDDYLAALSARGLSRT
ncbi:gamma-butyrobetaine hydroxylase-like domain-containing protein [Pedomonas sp. V897]|uniref:gamma-butyrobetaine hydroxylase-like domain-containing protein n=1 Tax=Pedomonas sp. V897 TaxID=3446482 RepID=UPI003EDF6BAE